MNQVEHRPTASVYSNGDFILVDTCSGYRSYSSDPDVPQQVLPMNASKEDLGRAIIYALSNSRKISRGEISVFFDVNRVVAHYNRWVEFLMGRYEYKTKRALFKKMKNCGVRCEGGNIVFIPMRHMKLESWEGISSDGKGGVVVSKDSSHLEIGDALIAALSMSIE